MPSLTASGSGTLKAPVGQAAAQGKPSHSEQGRSPVSIRGVPASSPVFSANTKMAPLGQASTQSPPPLHFLRKAASAIAPGGRW